MLAEQRWQLCALGAYPLSPTSTSPSGDGKTGSSHTGGSLCEDTQDIILCGAVEMAPGGNEVHIAQP